MLFVSRWSSDAVMVYDVREEMGGRQRTCAGDGGPCSNAFRDRSEQADSQATGANRCDKMNMAGGRPFGVPTRLTDLVIACPLTLIPPSSSTIRSLEQRHTSQSCITA